MRQCSLIWQQCPNFYCFFTNFCITRKYWCWKKILCLIRVPVGFSTPILLNTSSFMFFSLRCFFAFIFTVPKNEINQSCNNLLSASFNVNLLITNVFSVPHEFLTNSLCIFNRSSFILQLSASSQVTWQHHFHLFFCPLGTSWTATIRSS